MKTWMLIIWPAFVIAVPCEVVFFALFDPMDFVVVGGPALGERAAYSVSFLLFWAFGAASSALTYFLMRKGAWAAS
jgi:hypothetical protein